MFTARQREREVLPSDLLPCISFLPSLTGETRNVYLRWPLQVSAADVTALKQRTAGVAVAARVDDSDRCLSLSLPRRRERRGERQRSLGNSMCVTIMRTSDCISSGSGRSSSGGGRGDLRCSGLESNPFTLFSQQQQRLLSHYDCSSLVFHAASHAACVILT